MLDSLLYRLGFGARAKFELSSLRTTSWLLAGHLPSGEPLPCDLPSARRNPFISALLRAAFVDGDAPEDAGVQLAHQLLVGHLASLTEDQRRQLRGDIEASRPTDAATKALISFLIVTRVALEPEHTNDLIRGSPELAAVAVLIRRRVEPGFLKAIQQDVVQTLDGDLNFESRQQKRLIEGLVESLLIGNAFRNSSPT